MQDISTVPTTTEAQPVSSTALELYSQHKSGAQWFYAIAIVSVLNTLISLSGSSWSFIVGLGSTQLIDLMAQIFKEEAVLSTALITTIALSADALLVGMFALWGLLAKKGHAWAYIVGMVLYALDGLIFVVAQEWLSVAFHAFALWGLFRGVRALLQLKRLARSGA